MQLAVEYSRVFTILMTNKSELEIKLAYTAGLRDVVLGELASNPLFQIVREGKEAIYLVAVNGIIPLVKELGSVARAYLTLRSEIFHPAFLVNHKSILGDLVEMVLEGSDEPFKTFKISCAGSTSSEVRKIAAYITDTYHLTEAEEADLKVHITKTRGIWEVGVQVTPRPLSARSYKVRHMSGAMDPTVAFALNSLCHLEQATSYLNIFSGSGTLLIEAGLRYPNLKTLVGFDHDKKHLTLAVHNIKEAGLITKATVKEADLYDAPDFGTFDVITSDLPFGMVVGKGEDLEKLYRAFISYCETKLNHDGRLAVYTSEFNLFESLLAHSKFEIQKTLPVTSMTNVNAYLSTKIVVCVLK